MRRKIEQKMSDTKNKAAVLAYPNGTSCRAEAHRKKKKLLTIEAASRTDGLMYGTGG